MSQISFEKFADGIDVNWTERAADGGRGDALCRRIVSANPISRSLSFPSIWLFPIIKRNCWSVALIRLYIFSSADMFCFWTLITILLRKDGWLQISQRETGLTTNIWTCRGPARLDITSRRLWVSLRVQSKLSFDTFRFTPLQTISVPTFERTENPKLETLLAASHV